MKRFFSVFMVMSLAITACYCQTTDDEKYEQAIKYYDAKEYDKAIPLLRELETRNYAKALNTLGNCYFYGYGVDKDLKKGVEYFRSSANLGWARAQCNMGICYENGKGVPINKDKAYIWYEKAFSQYKESAEKGDSDAQLQVGLFYYLGRMRSGRDYLKSIPWFEKSANQGNSDACYYLGMIYQNANGVDKNLQKAYEYYLKGAEKGNCHAQSRLGWLLLDDDFSTSFFRSDDKYKQAEKWLRLAARENADYLYDLALFYLDHDFMDDVIDRDCEYYLKKAFDEGSGYAQASIGYRLLLKNECREAMELFRSAKENGVDSFSTFNYSESKELRVDVLIMICDFLLRNNSYQCLDAYYANGENKDYIVVVKQEGRGNGFIQLSKNGRMVSSSEMSSKNKNLYVLGEMGVELSVVIEEDDTNRHEIYFTDGYINMNALNNIFSFLKRYPEYQFQDAICCGDENIYMFMTNDGKNYSLKRINGTKVLNSTPESIGFSSFRYFRYNNSYSLDILYDIYPDFFIHTSSEFDFLNQDINFDLLFVLIDFAVNSDYEIGDVLSVGNDYVLVEVSHKKDKQNHVLKMSNTGKILAVSRPLDSSSQLKYHRYDVKKKNYCYLGYSDFEYLDLDAILNLFK